VDDSNRIVHIQLDEKIAVRRRPEVEHERAVAIYDILEGNRFAPVADFPGPFNLHLSASESRLVLDVRSQADDPLFEIPVGLKEFQSLVKEYFLICEAYYKAIRRSSPSQIEAIDLGRRGLHNEGAQLLKERLAGKVEIDMDTARRLFTLICVLHVRG
jgi:uncharacterized protein (UPF0262 family)